MKITGKRLIGLGYKPGKWFAEALIHTNENQLVGEELTNYLDTVCPPPTIVPFEKGVAYFKNIQAENKVEQDNINKVMATMDELMKTPTLINGAIMPDACPTGGKGQIPVG
ncbi:MAG: tRNA-splicing ligase RtcB, partial [Cognaticolwellia sp.]